MPSRAMRRPVSIVSTSLRSGGLNMIGLMCVRISSAFLGRAGARGADSRTLSVSRHAPPWNSGSYAGWAANPAPQ